MATIEIADNDARVQYTQAVTANTTQLTIDFPFFDLDNINVIVTTAAGVDTTLSRGTGTGTFAVTGTAVDDGFSGGYVTLGDSYSAGTDTFTIFRDIAVARTTDFPTSGPFNISSLNTELDKITAIEQELETKISRTLGLAESDTSVSLALPNLNTRKGTVLAFNNTTGIPEAGPNIGQLTTIANLSADISTLADIEDGTVATDAISDTAAIASDVTSVAGIANNVSTVAGISSDVTAVAADATDIGTVATNIADVSTVATNIADVVTVANDLNEAISEIETAADDLNEAVSEIDTVATNIANVNKVGAIDADVTTVAGIDSDVTTVAGISANVTTVAGIDNDVTTVSGISADVTTVAADGADIGTVAGISSDVTTVSGLSGNVTTVAGISSDVTSVANIASDVTTAASSISAINDFNDIFFAGPTAPSSPSAGDLWYDTVNSKLKVYVAGSGFQEAGSYLEGLTTTHIFTATAAQTTFTTDDSSNTMSIFANGNTLVFLNGVRLVEGATKDYTISGNSVILNSGAGAGDVVYVEVFTKITLTQETSLNNLVSQAQTSATNAATSETNAATSASNASTSETNAATSASSASTSATTATTQASASSTSASNAATSEANAASSATAAAASATQAAASAGGGTLKISSNDTTADVLENKLTAGTGVTITKNNSGANETLSVAVNPFSLTESNATATASQTSFSVTYTAGLIQVFVNGVKLINGSDFTATNGTTVVLTSGASAGDVVEFVVFG